MAKISWFQLLRTAPAVKRAVEKMSTPGALESDQNYYNLLKAVFALLSVCGVAGVAEFTDADLGSISAIAAIAVPASLTFIDAAVNFWLRVRKPDSKEALAKRAEGN